MDSLLLGVGLMKMDFVCLAFDTCNFHNQEKMSLYLKKLH